MFLIDQPFVSEYLIKTIKENQYRIITTCEAEELITDKSLNWISEQQAIEQFYRNPQTAIYSNSENALSWIEEKLDESELPSQIKVLKDKLKFRDLLKDIFPGFHYQKISLSDIQKLTPEKLHFPFVIKPVVGFFSIGVHIVKNKEDWEFAKKELQPKNLQSIFPENVLNTAHFIIEEYIEGEEYAIDYYHNANGEVVILNIMHHLFSSGSDTSDRVYSTSKEILYRHKTIIEEFLTKTGTALRLKNFPAHAEIRINEKGKITPIEINPFRFGGWCTTGDLLGLSLGFNSYSCYMEGRKPNWDEVFKGKEDKTYSIVVLDNNSGIAPANIADFNYPLLANDFEKPVLIRKFSIKECPVFGFVFSETSSHNKKELQDILTSDLKKYITITH